MATAHLLFVYGTLLEGQANHERLRGARALGRRSTADGFALVDLGAFPALVRAAMGVVLGELYEVDAVVLRALDRFEGHPDLFRRAKIPLAEGSRAFAYLGTSARVRTAPRIPSGDFRQYVAALASSRARTQAE